MSADVGALDVAERLSTAKLWRGAAEFDWPDELFGRCDLHRTQAGGNTDTTVWRSAV